MGFFSVSLLRFFYSPYGLGLTALSLCSLIGNTAEKGTWKKKIIPAGLLVILFIPVFGYLLNGGLYTKDKVFIQAFVDDILQLGIGIDVQYENC